MQNPQAPPAPTPAEYDNLAGLRQQALVGGAGRPYYKTAVGILKLVSICLGFIAMIVCMIGYTTGTWFHQVVYGVLCNPEKDLTCTRGYRTHDTYKNYPIYPETACQYIKDEKIKGITNDTGCPSKWLVVPQVFIFSHTWAATVIVYVILLQVDLSNYRAFSLFDLIGHAIASLLTIVSGLCIFGFFAVAHPNQNCSTGPLEEKECKTIFGREYRHLYMFCGGILTVFTGIVYLVIVIRLNITRRIPKFANYQNMGQWQMQQADPSQYPVQESPSTHAAGDAEPSQAPENAK